MLTQQSIYLVSIEYTCDTYLFNALVHVMYTIVSAQYKI